MQKADIVKARDEFIESNGPWEAHNVHLGEGVYTLCDSPTNRETRLLRLLQMAQDLTGQPISDLSVLDLACAEGINALGFAQQGAKHVLGLEGRQQSVDKCNFVKNLQGLENLDFTVDDVRNLSPEKHGTFDVVLSLGIFYHLVGEDACKFVHAMHAVCNRVLILDTEISLYERASFDFDGETYSGARLWEHDEDDSSAKKSSRTLASLDNSHSFWFTKPSLLNLLRKAGFNTVVEGVRKPNGRSDRVIFVAFKGNRISGPQFDNRVPLIGDNPWPEGAPDNVKSINRWWEGRGIPRPIRSLLWRTLVKKPKRENVGRFEREAF